MVSSKILRQVELVCRLAKNCQTYFGSIQVILCGDFYQLHPIKDELYGDFGHYCFEVDFFNKIIPHTVTLKNVHRQAANEDHLITAVNELEKGCVSDETVNFLRSLSRPLQSETCLKLFARNLDVDIFNYERLQLINNPLRTFIADDEGDPFYLKKMLAPKKLGIKIAAPVMLLTNITDQLVNGATGTVMKIEDEIITVDFQIHGACKLVNLQRFKFTKFEPVKNIVIASRYQFSIKLCFGVTIHKSQGMSIPNLGIDCKVACLPVQIGVAVGRAITTDGLRVLNFSPSLCREHPSKVYNFINANDIGELCDSLHCC